MTLEIHGARWLIRLYGYDFSDPIPRRDLQAPSPAEDEVAEFIVRQVLEKDVTLFEG